MNRILLLLSVIFLSLGSYAVPKYVTVDGLKYFADPDTKEASLVANNYSGDIIVPESFSYDGIIYTVTSFADACFENCSELKSVTIPSSVRSLGDNCFKYCSCLTSITIPSSVTKLGEWCFWVCSGLTNVIIPSSITELSAGCFCGCINLKSIVIPSSVSRLDDSCFSNCKGLTSITISSSVTFLGKWCFEDCVGLTSITIPSSVKSLDFFCFMGCSNLKSITCQAQTPPSAYGAFDSFDKSTCILYVPDVDAYKSASGWKNFKYIYKIKDDSEDPSEGIPCSKPIISYADGKLQFFSETDGAKYHCTVTTPDLKTDVLNETGSMELSAYYNISVYATADGHTKSETATAKLYWVKADGNLTTDNINAAKMRGIVVSADNGFVRLSGLTDGESVQFYAADGKMLSSQKAVNGSAALSTSEAVIICKMGTTSIKILTK